MKPIYHRVSNLHMLVLNAKPIVIPSILRSSYEQYFTVYAARAIEGEVGACSFHEAGRCVLGFQTLE